MKEIKELKAAITKELLRVAPAYLVYFLIATIILVSIFGEIKYGANFPYLTSLMVIGIPFLICFCHLLTKAENFRIKFTEAGGDKKAASNFMTVLIIIIPFILLYITLFFFKLLERIQG
jgi:cytochrome bd-type quinol oxidase subunit 2